MQVNASAEGITLLAAGDCGPSHGPAEGFPLERYTELVRPTLAAADLRYVNCMRQYSLRGVHNEKAPHGRQPPEMAQVLTDCRFDVANIGNNHMFDAGPDALLDTRDFLQAQGIQVMGAGRDLDEARRPAIVERNGIRVGFLGVSSLLPHGSEAGPGKPGLAPLHVTTSYETRGPHAPVRVRTEPDERDLQRIVADIRALRKEVDVVIQALHCGIVWLPRIVPDYHVAVAHACVDAGADLVLGHASHLPKGIEVYKDRTIFYSLSTFCLTKPFAGPGWSEAPWKHGATRNHAELDPDYPLLPFGRDAKWSLLAKVRLARSGVKGVSFLPVMIDRLYRPEPLRATDPRFGEMLRYAEWVSEGFDHRFEVQGDEVAVLP